MHYLLLLFYVLTTLFHNLYFIIFLIQFYSNRDEATEQRLGFLKDPWKLYRCHTIMNCTNTCPKHLNPARAIIALKQLCVGMKKKDKPQMKTDALFQGKK